MRDRKYRDRIYIIKDIILTLAKYGQLNQTALTTYCGLNLTKHKNIILELEANELITKIEEPVGKKSVIIYKPTHKGIEFCKNILEPFEEIFPRDWKTGEDNTKLGMLLLV